MDNYDRIERDSQEAFYYYEQTLRAAIEFGDLTGDDDE